MTVANCIGGAQAQDRLSEKLATVEELSPANAAENLGLQINNWSGGSYDQWIRVIRKLAETWKEKGEELEKYLYKACSKETYDLIAEELVAFYLWLRRMALVDICDLLVRDIEEVVLNDPNIWENCYRQAKGWAFDEVLPEGVDFYHKLGDLLCKPLNEENLPPIIYFVELAIPRVREDNRVVPEDIKFELLGTLKYFSSIAIRRMNIDSAVLNRLRQRLNEEDHREAQVSKILFVVDPAVDNINEDSSERHKYRLDVWVQKASWLMISVDTPPEYEYSLLEIQVIVDKFLRSYATVVNPADIHLEFLLPNEMLLEPIDHWYTFDNQYIGDRFPVSVRSIDRAIYGRPIASYPLWKKRCIAFKQFLEDINDRFEADRHLFNFDCSELHEQRFINKLKIYSNKFLSLLREPIDHFHDFERLCALIGAGLPVILIPREDQSVEDAQSIADVMLAIFNDETIPNLPQRIYDHRIGTDNDGIPGNSVTLVYDDWDSLPPQLQYIKNQFRIGA